MSVFFKIADDGKDVYVVKNMVEKKISEEDFEKSAKRVSVEKFLSEFPEVSSEKLEKVINRVQKICEMKLSSVTISSSITPVVMSIRYYYDVAGKIFRHDYGQLEEFSQKEYAIQYAKEFYGEELANSRIIPMIKEDSGSAFFSRREEISKEKYEELINEKKELTSIKFIEKKLNTSNKR